MISVVYICPSFIPEYLGRIRAFCESYSKYPDMDHEFVVALKGDGQLPSCFSDLSVVVERHPNTGLDCGSYKMVCESRMDTREAICFLGTHSLLIDDRWLTKLSSALLDGNATIVGASGSHEAGTSYRTYNPHIRTTGFMMRPKDLLEIYPEPLESRADCIEFESGVENLTRRTMRRGGECLVVGRDGQRYPVSEWGQMNGFRQGNQANLLIWDNHADMFAGYDAGNKRFINLQTFPAAPFKRIVP